MPRSLVFSAPHFLPFSLVCSRKLLWLLACRGRSRKKTRGKKSFPWFEYDNETTQVPRSSSFSWSSSCTYRIYTMRTWQSCSLPVSCLLFQVLLVYDNPLTKEAIACTLLLWDRNCKSFGEKLNFSSFLSSPVRCYLTLVESSFSYVDVR